MRKIRKMILSGLLIVLTIMTTIMQPISNMAAAPVEPEELNVKDTSDRTGGWDIPRLNFIYCSKIDGLVYNYVKYIADDAANGWRLAYCTQLSNHFEDSTTYIAKTWQANGMYSEISYALAHGCKKYAEKNDSAYSTGDWVKDYYVTQTVIYCILADYGYDGHLISTLSAESGYEDVYYCVQTMYQAVKANAGQDGYGDLPSYNIAAPQDIVMKLSGNKQYYESDWYTVTSVGKLESRSIELEGAPEGCEIVYEYPEDLMSRFFIHIPVEKANEEVADEVSFKVKATAQFNRPFVYTYESLIADKQNITFQEESVQPAPESSEAKVVLKVGKCSIALEKKDAESGNGVAGAVYGVYSDAECTELIGRMPETDSNGHTELSMFQNYNTVYVKEISASVGYLLDTEVRNVELVNGATSTIVVKENQAKGRIKGQKNESAMEFEASQADGRLTGAEYGLFSKDEIIHPDGQTGIVHKAGELVATAIVDEKGAFEFANLYLGNYYLKELKSPPGYLLDQTEYPVTLAYQDQNIQEVVETVEVTEQPTVVEFSKVVLTTGKELPGCKLKVLNEEEAIVDEWTSTEVPHRIKGLIAGKKYTFVETKPADGYLKAEKVQFTVKETGEIQKVVMKDDYTKVSISKQDITNKKELPGASLIIKDKEGKEVESWVSSEKPHMIECLPAGEYTLIETSAPKGYVIAEAVCFAVKETGDVQKVVMYDEKEKVEKKTEKPQTGDSVRFMLLVILFAADSLALTALIFKRKRLKK